MIGKRGGLTMPRELEPDPILFIDRGGRGLEYTLEPLPELPHQRRKKPAKSNLQTWNMIGSDTETVEGRLWLFSTEQGVWECPTFNHLMSVLYNDAHTRKWKKGGKRGRRCLQHFYWNLKFDAQAILRLLHPEVAEALTASRDHEGEIASNKVTVNADTGNFGPERSGRMVELSYLEGKSLVITPKNWYRGAYKLGPCWMWDISQFFYKIRLNSAAQQYLNRTKLEECFDGSILDASRFDEPDYRDYYREDIEKYAVIDAELAGELARMKRNDFVETGVRFIQPYSLANVAQRALLDNCKIPTISGTKDNPKGRQILQYAHSAYRGGWFETTGSGYWEDVQGIDLASAYPYILHHLPDIDDREGAWFMGDEPDEFLDWLEHRSPYSIGFAEIAILFEPGMNWHPLAKMAPTGTIVTPRLARGWFSADEIAEAIKWPHLQYEIGRWCYFDEAEPTRPFAPFIEHFYEMKHRAGIEGKKIEYAVSKVMLNSIYGKTRQAVNDKAGQLWNPMYASTVTGATRARLAELLRLNDYSALSVATDGILFPTEKLRCIPERPLPAPRNLGQWELEEQGELSLLMSGVYSMKSDDFVKTVFRGHASLFLQNRTDLFQFCEEHSTKSHLSTTIRRPYSAGEARVRGDMELMNRFREVDFTIRPAGDSTKRLWGRNTPVYFGDLLSQWWPSRPHERV